MMTGRRDALVILDMLKMPRKRPHWEITTFAFPLKFLRLPIRIHGRGTIISSRFIIIFDAKRPSGLAIEVINQVLGNHPRFRGGDQECVALTIENATVSKSFRLTERFRQRDFFREQIPDRDRETGSFNLKFAREMSIDLDFPRLRIFVAVRVPNFLSSGFKLS